MAVGPPFSGPGFLVPHFQVLHFPPLTFGPPFSGPAFSVHPSVFVNRMTDHYLLQAHVAL